MEVPCIVLLDPWVQIYLFFIKKLRSVTSVIVFEHKKEKFRGPFLRPWGHISCDERESSTSFFNTDCFNVLGSDYFVYYLSKDAL